jgi:hypothetical protein
MKRADASAHRKPAKALCDVGELRAKQSERDARDLRVRAALAFIIG